MIDAQLVWDTANNPTFSDVLELRRLPRLPELSGARFVRLAVDLLTGRAPLGLETAAEDFQPLVHKHGLVWLAVRMAGAALGEGERDELIAELRSRPLAERQMALALSVAAGACPLLELLDHADGAALARILVHGASTTPQREGGALDLAEVRAAVGELRTLGIDELCDLLSENEHTISSRWEGDEPLRRGDAPPHREVVRATLDLNRADVTRRMRHHAHDAIRAYGALPLAPAEDPADRYRELQASLSRASRLRVRDTRWRNHLQAVHAATDHLAQVAGHLSAQALETALAPAASAAVTPQHAAPPTAPSRSWYAGPYRLTLEPTPTGLAIVAHRGARRLKHLPKALYGDLALAEARLAQAAGEGFTNGE